MGRDAIVAFFHWGCRMKIFAPDSRRLSQHHQKLYAAYELAFTLIEFAAGVLFLVGSVMFFYHSWQTPAVWCFVIGSACFVIGPSLKVVREIHYALIGDFSDLAKRVNR